MAKEVLLRGACSCGRNQYHIHTNLESDVLQLVLGEKADQGKRIGISFCH